MLVEMFASIPSPTNGALNLGPIPLHVYGLLLAIGVVVAAVIAERRWVRWGQDKQVFQDALFWIVLGGVIGARLYHVLTDYQLFTGDWLRIFEIWKGGLSIWGVMAGGLIAVVIVARVKHINTFLLTDAIVPGLLVAQGIGRWGNYFNQELFGKPTNLPWSLEIDVINRPTGFESFSKFHPTFLYESIYCLLLVALILWVERRWRLRTGQTSALYLATYCFGRFGFENLRIDEARVVLGLRINAWVTLVVMVIGIIWFIVAGRRGQVDPGRYPDKAQSLDSNADADSNADSRSA